MGGCANCGHTLGLKQPIWWWHIPFCCQVCRTLYKSRWWRDLKRRPPHALRTFTHIKLCDWSLGIGLATSVAVFAMVGIPILLDQWIIGQVGALFMLGTALVIAGVCIGLFTLIVAAGLLVSSLFGEDDAQHRRRKTAAPQLHQRSNDRPLNELS